MTGNIDKSVSDSDERPADAQIAGDISAESVVFLLSQIDQERPIQPPQGEFNATVEFGTTSLEDLIADAASNSGEAMNLGSKRSSVTMGDPVHEQTEDSEQTDTTTALPELAAVKVFFGDDEGFA